MTVILLILVLSFLVIIHELGHLFAALWSKVKVEEFGIGYPPKVWTLFTWKNIPFTINAIPFGGFVRMAGEEPGAPQSEKKGQFTAASIPHRIVIVLAGAAVNFLYGVIAFSILFSVIGIPTQLESARISAVAPDSPAALAGIPVDVDIISLRAPRGEGEPEPVNVSVKSSAEVIEFVKQNQGKTITLVTTGHCEGTTCAESAQEFQAYIRTIEETPAGQGSLGIGFTEYGYQFYPWWEMPFRSSYFGVQQAVLLGKEILFALKGLGSSLFTSGSLPSELAGPVGIVDQAQSAGLIDDGWIAIISFSAMLSINLAIMNILPIPPLDGGRAVFILLETVLQRKHLDKLEYWSNYGGYIFLLGLIVIVTLRDVWRIIARI